MVTEQELEGFRNDRYLARSWALLTRDKGWIKPVLVMTVANLVPIAGPLGTSGYGYEWARLTAWGVNAAPKQKNVKVGECIASGWRGFVVALVWGLCVSVIGRLFSGSDFLSELWSICALFLNVVIMACILRATIYQKIIPGLRLDRIWEMVKHDPVGLLRVVGIQLLFGAILFVAELIVSLGALVSILPDIVYAAEAISYYGDVYGGVTEQYVVQLVFEILASLGPVLVVMILLGSFVSVLMGLVGYTALGLWFRQFNVPAWGKSEDPLPPFVSDPRSAQAYGYGAATEPPAPTAAQPSASAPDQPWGQQAAPAPEQPTSAPAPEQPWAPQQEPEATAQATNPYVDPVMPYDNPAAQAPWIPVAEAPQVEKPVEPVAPEELAEPESPLGVEPAVPEAPLSETPEPLLGAEPEANGEPSTEILDSEVPDELPTEILEPAAEPEPSPVETSQPEDEEGPVTPAE